MTTTWPLHEFGTLSAVASLAAASLLASVWQGVLLAACVAACLTVLRGLSAAARSVIWTAVLLLVASLPVLPLWQHGNVVSPLAHRPALHLDPRWSFVIVAVWAALSLFRLGQLAVSAWRLRSLGRNAVVVNASPAIRALLSAGGRRAELCISTEVDRPSVAGFFRPRILLPPGLLARLPEPELAQIVLHEMEHLRRRDDWTNLLQKLALAVLPLNPVLFWLDRRLSLERELACDDGVLQAADTHKPQAARKAYAACLTNLAEGSLMRRRLSLALGVVGNWKPQSEVGRRVLRILRRPEAAMGRTQTRFAAGALLAGSLAGAVLLGHSPALVSFVSPSGPVVAEASAVPPPLAMGSGYTGSVSPMAASNPDAFRVRLVKATMPVTAVHARATRTSTGKSRRHVSAAPRMTSVHPERAQRAPWEVLASWETDAPPARLGLMLLQNSQFRYAAVPVRDGWLIVQL